MNGDERHTTSAARADPAAPADPAAAHPADAHRTEAAPAAVVDVTLDARDLAVALTIAPGETLAVIGPNGAGKSTLVDLVAGLLRPDRGDVVLGGRPVVHGGRVLVPAHRRRIGLVGQEPTLFPHLSVLDNVAYGPRATGQRRGAARTRAVAALAAVGAEALAARRPSSLSGGQAQRVAVARALATRPDLLLLDEPTSALDVGAQEEVRRVLGAVRGRATLLVTHDPLEVMTLADRVAVLEHGRIVELGTVDRVLRHPTSDFGAAFSGLTLLAGTATADGVRLDDGTVVLAAHVAAAVGARAVAVYHPTAARLAPAPADGEARPAPATTAVVRRVDLVQARDGLMRVVAGPFVVDVTVAALAAADARVGGTVTVCLPAEEVAVSAARTFV